MANEIERKFLVKRESWTPPREGGADYRQGYLSVEPARTVRVRVAGQSAFITVKGLTSGIERLEFEYAIPVSDADTMLDALCLRPLVEKVRYRVSFGGRVWEIDEFHGDNEGLLIAEVELPDRGAAVEHPPWVGKEVSGDPRYFNSNLAVNPYSRWKDVGNR